MSTYAISTALFKDIPLDEAISKTLEAGFHEFELSGVEGHLENWIADPARMRRILESAGIVARAVHTPSAGWDNGAADDAARRASIDVATASFVHAAGVGAGIVICHPNKPTDPFTPETFEANLARSRESLAILAERAKAAGVRMAVENLPVRGQPRPGASVADVLRMIDGLGDHVGICLDAGHSNANGLSAAKEVLEAGERLIALHIQDNDGSGEDQHILPGRGTTDWGAFLASLDTIGFEGLRTFEVMRGDDAEAILQGLARLRREWVARG